MNQSSCHYTLACNGKKVKVGFLYSAAYTANQNSLLHNLRSGSWLAKASGAAALCGLSIAHANGQWTRGCSQQAHHRPNQPHQAFSLISIHQMAPLWAKQWTSNYCIYRPRKDERLSGPSWLTCSRWFTHTSGHPSAAGRAQDRESSPAKDQRSTTVPRNQPVALPNTEQFSKLFHLQTQH